MIEVMAGFVVGVIVTGWLAWFWVSELRQVIQAFVDETEDYMKLNGLGDASNQHNVKWARRVLGETQ